MPVREAGGSMGWTGRLAACVRRERTPHTYTQTLTSLTLAQGSLAYHRVLKVSRTIANLDGADLIDTPRVAEALQYRKREGD